MNNHQKPWWKRYFFIRWPPLYHLKFWLPIALWLTALLSWLPYLLAAIRLTPGPPSSIEIAAAVNGSLVLAILVLLITQYLSEFIRSLEFPLAVELAKAGGIYAQDSQHYLDHHAFACVTADDELPDQADENNRMPVTTEKDQPNSDDSSDQDRSSIFPHNKDVNQALAQVNQIGQTLTSSLHLLDFAAICRTVLESSPLKELFPFNRAEICILNEETGPLAATLRLPDETLEIQILNRTEHLDTGYTGWIIANQQSLRLDDTRQSDIAPKEGVDNFPYQSYLGVPLKVGLKLLGTLELAAISANVYGPQDIALLEILANQISIAVDHARLFDETQHKVSELSLLFETSRELSATLSYDDLLRNLSQQMLKAFPADDCAIFDYDDATGTLTLSHKCSDSISRKASIAQDLKQAFSRMVTTIPAWESAATSRLPFIIQVNDPQANSADVELVQHINCGAMLAVPLVSRDKITGLITLFAVAPDAFTVDQIPLAQSLANQAGIALENARLFDLTDQRLQRRLDELEGLQRVSSELNSTLDLDRILDLVLTEAMRVTQATLGYVDLYDARTGNPVAHKEQGEAAPNDSSQALTPDAAAVGQKMMQQALDTGEAVLIADVRSHEDYVGFGRDTRSRVVVPIYYAGEPAGVINLESSHSDFFTQNQLRYLKSLANQSAVAIGNAQAYEEQKHEREQAGRRIAQLSRLAEISNIFRTNRPLYEVLEDIAYAISESVGFRIVLVSLVVDNPPIIRHEVGAGIPLPDFEAFRIVADVQPLENLKAIMLDEFRLGNFYFIPVEHSEVWQGKLAISYAAGQEYFKVADTVESDDRWQNGDLLFTPLRDTEDNIIGLLTVEDPDTGQRPTATSVETLEIFANHAATAMENARLFDLEQQRRRQADTLRGVAETISSQLEFDELLNIVLRELANVIDYDSVAVLRLEVDRLVIIGGQVWDYSEQFYGQAFSMMDVNPHRLVIETQEPVLINNVRQEYPDAFNTSPFDQMRSWLGVPLTYGTNILGVMSLGSTEADVYGQEETEVALAFANQVAVAMQNASLFDEAREQVRQLAALTEVAQALNRALDLNEVLNLVLDAVFDLVGHHKGSIWLVDNVSNTIKIANTKNISDVLVDLFNESLISVDSEPFASVIKSGKVLVVESSENQSDNMTDVDLDPFPDDVTYVPLKTEQGVIGILAIETVIQRQNMLQLVTTLADLAAIAIDNTRLLDYTRQRANEMQNLYNLGVEVSGMLDVHQVMRSVIDNAVILSQTQLGVILFWDEEANHYIFEGTASEEKLLAKLSYTQLQVPDSTGDTSGAAEESEPESAEKDEVASLWLDLTQRILDSGHPLNVDKTDKSGTQSLPTVQLESRLTRKLFDTFNVQALLGVPIEVQNQTSGVIFVGSTELRSFGNHDVQILSFVANQAAVAVRNAQLVQRLNLLTEELEQRVAQRTEELASTLQDLTEERDRVEALYQITRELSASLDLDRILTQALSLINRAVGISHGSILLRDQESGALIYRAALGRDTPLPTDKVKDDIDYVLAEQVIDSQRFEIIADLAEVQWVSGEDKYERRSAMAVPLVTGEDAVGALQLFHPEVDYFTQDHLKLVAAAASQVATAINNAELYRLITDQADRLGVMLRTQAAEAAKSEAILHGITDGVLVLDADRKITLVNPKAAEILDIDPTIVENQRLDQILGKSTSSVNLELTQHIYDNLLHALEVIEAGQASAEFRVDVEGKAVIVTLAPVALGAEELPSIVTVLRDISREAQIERMKNEFISTVSHELRTPLTSIKGYADLLVSSTAAAHLGDLNPTQRRFIEVIQSNANRLDHLVKDILEISRIETGRVKLELESLDLIAIIKEVAVSFEGQQVQKPMNISMDLPDSLPPVYADKARVVQILVNLIGNAWRYTPENGDITVRATLRNDALVQVDVADTGIGIVDEDLAYIFDRFFRSERSEVEMVDGTGLGLSITHSFVEMLGGEIWVESEVDVGSTFSFTLPLASTTKEDTEVEMGATAKAHILLIDHDPAVIKTVKSRLEKEGYGITATDSGAEALALVRKPGRSLDLVLLDLLLMERDSFELLRQLREDQATATVPVVMTAFLIDEKRQGLRLGVIDYVDPSSFEEKDVLNKIKIALHEIKSEVEETQASDRILIVNDDPKMADWLKEALEECGCYVERAYNSQQAMDMAVSKPDLILADTKMPGLDGESVVAQLRRSEDTGDIPIIAITDNAASLAENNTVKILSTVTQPDLWRAFSIDALVAEIGQISHNSIDRNVEE